MSSSSTKAKFEIYKDAANQFRWRFRAKNGEIVASGESYTTKEKCRHGVDVLKAEAKDAEIDDQTK